MKMKKMKKIISISLAITTALAMTGVIAFAPVASAITIVEGDVVSPDATFTDADGNTYYPYDVFIMKYVGDKKFKRLVLNPQVFESYGHLEWGNIKTGTVAELEAFTTSSLTRAIDDDKVYKLFPDGDIGTKRWVDTLELFTSLGYDWDSVYIINSTDRDNYTTGTTMAGEEPGVTGEITLSLAADTPAASTLPNNVQGVTFLKVNVTGSGTINQLTVKRNGAGAVGDFGDLYIYENGVRLTSGRSLSSATSKATFISLGIQAPTTIELVADISTGTAGDINYFTIESSSDVTSDATIGGVFPLNGNPMGISGTAAGTLTIAKSGPSSRDVTIGATETEISQFKITTVTEGTNLERIQLFNGGDCTNTKITNLKLKDQEGTTVATATEIGADGYLSFVFDSLYYIKKGDNEIFRVYADIGAVKPARTIKLYLELATDVLGTGTTYGFGMAATITDFDSTTSGEAVQVTCKGGDLTLNKVGPNATNIGTKTDDTVFLEYTVSAAADVTIKRTELIFCHDNSGGSSYQEASGSAGADITDIKIVDKDTGTVIAGPKDGTAFNDSGDTSGEVGYDACPSATNGIAEAFTDTFDISAGDQKTFQVTADIDITATDSGIELTATDVVKFILYSYSSMVTSTGTISYMKYTGTTDAVKGTAIAPSGNIAGEEMTLEAASLTLTLAATPSGADATSNEKVYIKGHSGVEAVGLIFEAGTASDVTVDSITLHSYIAEGTTVAPTEGIDTNYVKDSIGNVYIYEKESGEIIPGSSAKGFSNSTNSYGDVAYTGLSWTIPAGETKTLLVKADISSAAPASGSGAADTWIGFDIEDGDVDVSAVDKDGNTVSIASTYDAPNAAGVTTNFGIADYGSITIAVASDTPDKSLLVMGTDDNEVSKFKLSGTYEAWNIERFGIGLYDGNAAATNAELNDRDNFTGVALKYQTESQFGTENWTISSKKTFGATASLAFNFTADADKIYVPKDDDTYVTVLVDVKDYLGGTGAKSKVPVMINHSTSETTGFKAYGAQSGTQKTTLTTTTVPNTSLALHFITRSKPVFAKESTVAAYELARFSITAVGYDVIFDGGASLSSEADIASACLRFDIIASSTDDESGTLTLYDWNENILASSGTLTWGTGAVTSVSFVFEVKDATITGGQTKSFHIDLAQADYSGDFLKTDEYIYLQLRNDDGGSLATGSMGYGERDIVWHDGTAEEGITSVDGDASAESRFGMPALIKNIGPLPITFTVIRGTTTP